MPDANGTPYAKTALIHAGSTVTAGHVTKHIPVGAVLPVTLTPGPSPRLVVPSTRVNGLNPGQFALAGQLEPDGTIHGGISPDRTEYLGFY